MVQGTNFASNGLSWMGCNSFARDTTFGDRGGVRLSRDFKALSVDEKSIIDWKKDGILLWALLAWFQLCLIELQQSSVPVKGVARYSTVQKLKLLLISLFQLLGLSVGGVQFRKRVEMKKMTTRTYYTTNFPVDFLGAVKRNFEIKHAPLRCICSAINLPKK